ncbi:MAG: vanadium-dependent haloperoxidase [Bacteroidetes bacterium]|nr:vanadium-dependent haloperoxidase [Bacteroidota bacterium]
MIKYLAIGLCVIFSTSLKGQHSVARQWNEVLLDAIRHDYARPTVHARNLFHTSIAMYDAWAAFDEKAIPFFIGNSLGAYDCQFEGIDRPTDIKAAREEAMSYAAFRLISHRFRASPGKNSTKKATHQLMTDLGYDMSFKSTNYEKGNPAALGNYIARQLIAFGLNDGSNEKKKYKSKYYEVVNPMLIPDLIGNPDLKNPNRWQPLGLELNIDQSSNRTPSGVTAFLGPEWGNVIPFSLKEDDLRIYKRDGNEYRVYHDPGPPPYIDPVDGGGLTSEYQWNFEMNSIWSSHLDPRDSVLWDISPASTGNAQGLPNTLEEYHDYYKYLEGGDPGRGRALNPRTGNPYDPQIVPRADYTRVLAEFWADGPDSETPPGHWFTILNYVSDHPQLVKKFAGEGELLDDLEWDVKSYFVLSGAMHDAAIAAWGIKGWYDYIRPISALRYMASQGQSTSPDLPHYSPAGLPLVEGYIEQITERKGLGMNPKNIGKIQIRSWRGPDFILRPEKDLAGVGWILAEDWWPYQRPSFVTPPFAGYVSGHSTFSRAAAEVMTLFTGDEFFPGGMAEFYAKKNEFLVFEEGPSVDVTLQWATYRDASDQTSLSRIWGGIHPPADDIPGRIIGEKIGVEAFNYAMSYFGVDK